MTSRIRTAAGRGKPIIFSAPMIRALLNGRKTQTRRVCKKQDWAEAIVKRWPNQHYTGYEVSDRLWVRETFAKHASGLDYRADWHESAWPQGSPWTPPIHMPRLASRLTLTITGVKVERLRAISDADANAEGIYARGSVGDDPMSNLWTWQRDGWRYETPSAAFLALWKSINGEDSLKENPFVVAVSFTVEKRNVDAD